VRFIIPVLTEHTLRIAQAAGMNARTDLPKNRRATEDDVD
jgi:hypothetical protein